MRAFFAVRVFLLVLFCLQRLPQSSEASKSKNTIKDLLREIKHNNGLGYNPKEPDNYSWSHFKHLVKFFLYTRERPDDGHQLIANDTKTLISSPFNEENPTKILVHGWLGNGKNERSVCSMIKSEYFMIDDYNVICVDWSILALDWPYITARKRCRHIGNEVAEFITFLTNNTDLEPEDIHVIGLSMGAHVSGYAGKRLDGRLQRITGLDPAKPFFPEDQPQERLSKDDAMFVDIVHTTNIMLGQHQPIGMIDFYPNGGNTKQPGCGFEYIYGEVCSHLKALEFYASSIRAKDKFKSVKCDSWNDYKQSKCDDDDDFTYLGEYADQTFSGNYYLSIS